MPLSDHVESTRRSDGGHSGPAVGPSPPEAESVSRRRGMPLDLNDTSSILSPLLSHLSSLSAMPTFKSLLPSTPPKATFPNEGPNAVRATWQNIDLRDGQGVRPVLVVYSNLYPLQMFTIQQSQIPDDPHVQEDYPAPEEVYRLAEIRDAVDVVRKVIPGASKRNDTSSESVLSVRLIDGRHTGGLRAVFLTISMPKKASPTLALVIVDLLVGLATHRLDLGTGTAGAVSATSRALVVSTTHPSPSLHVIDPDTLESLHPSMTNLPPSPHTHLPVFSLSGRLLAYATNMTSLYPGPDGLGSVVTAHSSPRPRSTRSHPSDNDSYVPPTGDAQTALLSSAVGIGSGVARGVWAGIKMGARVAGRAGSGRMARSAPADGRSLDEEIEEEEVSEEGYPLDDTVSQSSKQQGEWVRIIDLFPLYSTTPRLIAHFRLPSNRFSISQTHPSSKDQRERVECISHLSFSPDGITLFAASDGKVFHLLEVHPAGPSAVDDRRECRGEVWQTYELRRGHTGARVYDVVWDKSGRFVGVGTGRGTVHVFPIVPTGGPPSAVSHAALKIINPTQLYPLSTVVNPVARIRPLLRPDDPPSSFQTPACLTFLKYRQNPLSVQRPSFYQDLAIFRPNSGVLELSRLVVQAVKGHGSQAEKTGGIRRGSGLTEMMERAGLGRDGDLGVEMVVKAKWALPLAFEGDKTSMLSVSEAKSGAAHKGRHRRARTLAQAEIQTHCTNPRILPNSIYLSKQVDFFAARPTDEYTPLSLLDISSRSHHLTFRHEVEARASSSDLHNPSESAQPRSFDEPLLSALQTAIEHRPATSPIPGLPNGYGYGYGPKSKWTTLPIRHVALGLGEGVDRVRREYVRAQHIRTKRRASEHHSQALNEGSLSFEDDTVFPAVDDGEGEVEGEDGNSGSHSNATSTSRDDSYSSREPTGTESSIEDGDHHDPEDGWEVGWEEEYRRAVEDDGGPDDLVLGMLDEEEEEKKGWDIQRR